jgi:hypothetical protein
VKAVAIAGVLLFVLGLLILQSGGDGLGLIQPLIVGAVVTAAGAGLMLGAVAD